MSKKTINLIVSLICYINSCSNDKLIEVERDNYTGIENLELTGVISDIRKPNFPFHGFAIIDVNVIDSNVANYDPRKIQANYLCLIKDSVMELYTGVDFMSINDTIKLDLSEKGLSYFDNNTKEFYTYFPSIHDRTFHDYIKKHGMQKL